MNNVWHLAIHLSVLEGSHGGPKGPTKYLYVLWPQICNYFPDVCAIDTLMGCPPTEFRGANPTELYIDDPGL